MPKIDGAYDLEVGVVVPVMIANAPNALLHAPSRPLRCYQALLDIGSRLSGISARVVQALNLGFKGEVKVATVSGASQWENLCEFELRLPADNAAMQGAPEGRWPSQSG